MIIRLVGNINGSCVWLLLEFKQNDPTVRIQAGFDRSARVPVAVGVLPSAQLTLDVDFERDRLAILDADQVAVGQSISLRALRDQAFTVDISSDVRNAVVSLGASSWSWAEDAEHGMDPEEVAWIPLLHPQSSMVYFFNRVTGQTSWRQPSPDSSRASAAVVDHAMQLSTQAAMLWALARMSTAESRTFRTPGLAAAPDAFSALDQTLSALVNECHPQAARIQDGGNMDLYTVVAQHRMPASIESVANACGLPLLVPPTSGTLSVLQRMELDDEATARRLIVGYMKGLGVDPSLYDCQVVEDRWKPWLASLAAGSVNLFVDAGTEPDRKLFVALALLEANETMRAFSQSALSSYVQSLPAGARPSRLVLLYDSRAARAGGDLVTAEAMLRCYVLLGWHDRLTRAGAAVDPSFGISAEERKHLLCDPVAQRLQALANARAARASESARKKAQDHGAAADEGPMTAAQEWQAMVAAGGTPSAAMDELMKLVGLEEVKQRALETFQRMQAWELLPEQSRVPVTLNFAFVGNPGTGKTTVARLFGKLLFEIKARRTDTYIEKLATELKREGGKAFSALLQQAMGGVLFIDEAYQLEPSKDPAGRDIVDELLTAAENHREELTIIIAGYKEDIQQQLFAYNPGMASRFPEVPFTDFSEAQLGDIWNKFLHDRLWHVEEPNVSNVAVRRVARNRRNKGFGNARSVRIAFEAATTAALARWSKDRTAEQQCIIMADVLGKPPTRETLPALDAALRKLEALTGLKEVKDAVAQCVATAATNYHREIKGQPVLQVALNRLMLGNPGTGKTTVAEIYAQVLKSLNLLSKGSVEMRTASDFVGDVVGASAAKTNAILELSKGKVLVIDEAYNLNDNNYGRQVIDTIVEKVMGSPGEDIAVLMLGYEKEMRDMLREQNPGLARRFNPENALVFKDYDDTSLATITVQICAEDNLRVSFNVLQLIVQQLAQQRALPNFGNAGAVRNLLSVAKTRMMARLHKTGSDDTTLTELDVLGEAQVARDAPNADPLSPLRKLYAASHIIEQLSKLQKFIAVQRREGKDVTGMAGNWLFLGNPGTGKTTVAKCMGQMLFNLGVLVRNSVEITSAADLTGNVVGEAKGLVADKMGRARGGVLFIDEAYELGLGSFGQEAMTKLVEMLTLDEYRKGTVVILAGYNDSMQQMLQRNVGLASRFQKTLHFPDWSAEDAAGFWFHQAGQDGFAVDPNARPALVHAFKELITRPGWANARDAISARDRILQARSSRVYDAPEPTPTLTLEDIEQGMSEFVASRPPGQPRRQADIAVAYAEQTRQADRQQAPPAMAQAQAPAMAPQPRQLDEAGAVEAKDERFSEEDRIRNLRAAQEAKRQEDERLAALRAAEEELRRAEEEARRRADEAEAAAAREAAEQARREAEQIMLAQRRQERLREMGLCPASFRWDDIGDGWYRCQGGSHTMHIRDLD